MLVTPIGHEPAGFSHSTNVTRGVVQRRAPWRSKAQAQATGPKAWHGHLGMATGSYCLLLSSHLSSPCVACPRSHSAHHKVRPFFLVKLTPSAECDATPSTKHATRSLKTTLTLPPPVLFHASLFLSPFGTRTRSGRLRCRKVCRDALQLQQ